MRTPVDFEWHVDKDRRNLEVHGVGFDAAKMFEFETAVTADDDRRNYGEHREVAAGFIGERLHVLVFTMRTETLRVISLRKANRREIQRYVERIENEL